MAERLEDLLRECTVQVVRSPNSSGAGFFVAPGKVLTCEHVAGDGVSPDGRRTGLTVRWERDGQPPAQLRVTKVRVLPSRGRPIPALVADYPDVALLDVDAPRGHPCVMLDTGVANTDAFRAYGFPEEGGGVELTPVQLEYRGRHGSSPAAYLDLKSDTVKPGMSGSAVLNLRTGQVCGMIVASKHPERADGALAVPWAEIKAEVDLGSMLARNQAFHDSDSRWRNAIRELSDVVGKVGPEVAACLREQLRTPEERSRWAPVLKRLEQDPDGPLARELAIPWKRDMALTVFRDGCDDPGQLLPPRGSICSEHVEKLLSEKYLPAAVRLKQGGTQYTYVKVQRWLASLANGLARQHCSGGSATDIDLYYGWRYEEGRTGRLFYAAMMLFPLLALSATVACGFTAALAVILGMSVSGAFSPLSDSSQQILKSIELTRFRAALVVGLATCLASGCAEKLAVGSPPGLVVGLLAGFFCRRTNWLAIGFMAWAVGLVFGQGIEFPAGIGQGVVIGVGQGIGIGFIARLADGLVAGLSRRAAIEFAFTLAGFWPESRRPQAIMWANGLLGLLAGIAAGLVAGLVYGNVGRPKAGPSYLLSSGLLHGHEAQLATELAVGLAVCIGVCGRIWFRLYISAVWSALLRRGPLRFGEFLDWAVDAELLCVEGAAYQFRYQQLQDWLAPDSAARRSPTPEPPHSAAALSSGS